MRVISKKAKEKLLGVWNLWYFKYLVVCVIGVLIVGFIDENSVWAHIQNKRRINILQEEIAHYNQLNDANKAKIRQLETNPKAMEKIARERYFMKTDDEDIFVLSDDEKQPVAIMPADERTR